MFENYKAYKIVIDWDEYAEYHIYSAPTASKAKSMFMSNLRAVYGDYVNFNLISSCRRAPEYDALAKQLGGCIAWKSRHEQWQLDEMKEGA